MTSKMLKKCQKLTMKIMKIYKTNNTGTIKNDPNQNSKNVEAGEAHN